MAIICIVIAAFFVVAALAEIGHAIERERLQRGRDDHDEAVRADMASMPDDRLDDIGDWWEGHWI